MERLRVILPGEVDDRLLAELDPAVRVGRAGQVVLEVPIVDRRGEVGVGERPRHW